MNLIFNAEALRPPITGVGYYSYHLLKELVRSDEIEQVHCFSGTAWQDGATQLAVSEGNMSGEGEPATVSGRAISAVRNAIGMIPGTKALYDATMDRRFERYANALPGALYHETNYLFKPFSGPGVTTVHDLSHVRHPEFHKPDLVALLNARLPATLARADQVIAVSDVVRDDLIAHFDIDEARVSTVYEGSDERFQPRQADQCQPVLTPWQLGYKKYVLISATLEPRKGVDTLLEAWELLPEALRREFPLVMTGSSGWRNDAIRTKLQQLIDGGTVMHLGYVDAQVLPVLFSGAALFAYPSVYEGFGLPVLDAMRSGVAVVCRSGTSMAEFANGACALCDTGTAEELAERIEVLLEDADQRAAWAARGLVRAADFSWSRTAADTLAVYRRAL